MEYSLPKWDADDLYQAANLICTGIQSDLLHFHVSGSVEAEWMRPYLKPDMHVLDFGAGIGRVARHVSRQVDSVFASDVSGSMLKFGETSWCKGIENISWDKTAKPLSYDDETFDLIYAFMVFFHLERESNDLEYWIQELHRVAKPDALLLFDIDMKESYPSWHGWNVERMEVRRSWHKKPVDALYHVARKIEMP